MEQSLESVRFIKTDNPPRDAIVSLLSLVLESEPAYLPGVASGLVTGEQWLTRKQFNTHFLAYNEAEELIGHSAIRLNGLLPDGRLLPRPYVWEVGGVFVHPSHQKRGIATSMVNGLALPIKQETLWCGVRVGGVGEYLLSKAGWCATEQTFTWTQDDDLLGRLWHPSLSA